MDAPLCFVHMYIMQTITNCHYNDVHMIITLQPHNKFQLNFGVIMTCFAC